MKELWKRVKEWFVWMTSRRVGDAINAGCTYDEVLSVVNEEVAKL